WGGGGARGAAARGRGGGAGPAALGGGRRGRAGAGAGQQRPGDRRGLEPPRPAHRPRQSLDGDAGGVAAEPPRDRLPPAGGSGGRGLAEPDRGGRRCGGDTEDPAAGGGAGEIPSEHPLPEGPWAFRRSDPETAAAWQLIERARRRSRGRAGAESRKRSSGKQGHRQEGQYEGE